MCLNSSEKSKVFVEKLQENFVKMTVSRSYMLPVFKI